MTPNESVELLFKCRMEGAAEVDKLATSVRGVSAAAATSSEALSNLEKVILANTVAVQANTTALAGMEGGFDRAAGGATRLAGGARVATAELRILEGSMPIMAAGRFLSQMQMLGPIMQAAFPVFGAIALFGVLEQIVGKVQAWTDAHDPLIQAQKASLGILDQQSKKYDELKTKLHALMMDEYEREHGRAARELKEAQESDTKAGGVDEHNIERLKNLARLLREVSRFSPATVTTTLGLGGDPAASMGTTTISGTELTERQASMLKAAGMEAQLLGDKDAKNPFAGIGPRSVLSAEQIKAADEILRHQVQPELETAQEQQKVDSATGSDTRARVDQEARKKADEERKQRQRELDEAEKQAAAYLRSAQTLELTGLARINETYREKLELLGKTKKAIEDINAAYAIEVSRELSRIQRDNRAAIDKVVDANEKDADKTRAFNAKQFLDNLKKEIDQEKKDIDTASRVLQRSDESDADGVQRGLGVTLRSDSLAVSGGRMTGSQGAASDFQARITAANEVLRIETQRLDVHKLDAAILDLIAGKQLNLTDQELKDLDRLADLRKKNADDIYRAEEQYESQLQTLREKDLDSYRQMAGSLFDAIHGHKTNQWGKDFALGQVKQVFTNAVSGPLQQVGHLLGSVTGGSNIGGLLSGTVFDPKNKGVDEHLTVAKSTETHTKDTVSWLSKIYSSLTGQSATGDPASADPDIFNLPTIDRNGGILFGNGGILGTGAVPTISAGSTTSASSASGLSSFLAGMGKTGSLDSLTGGFSDPSVSWSQWAGQAAGTAALIAGAGMGIASGIGQGGVGGDAKAAASAMGATGALLGPTPLGLGLDAAAAITGIVGALFATGPQQRAKDIFNEVSSNAYMAPTAMNVIQGMNGTYQDFDARGNLRTSNLSAVPTVAEPYITSRVVNGQRTYYDVPGVTQAPYSGGAQGTGQTPVSNVTVNLNAIDSQSGVDFLMNNRHAVGEAVTAHLQSGSGERLAATMRFHTNGN